jgi:hypothetical protein
VIMSTPHRAAARPARGLGRRAARGIAGPRHLLVYGSAAEVAALDPDLAALAKVDCWAAIATAPGEDGIDFVSRFFAPAQGVPEEPVTGSSHCTLVPSRAHRRVLSPSSKPSMVGPSPRTASAAGSGSAVTRPACLTAAPMDCARPARSLRRRTARPIANSWRSTTGRRKSRQTSTLPPRIVRGLQHRQRTYSQPIRPREHRNLPERHEKAST